MQIDATLSHVLLAEQENLSSTSAYVQKDNVLITPPPSAEDLARLEKIPRAEPKDIVEFNGIEINLEDLASDENTDEDGFDIRTLTPRDMVDFSLDLYIEGALSFDEYSLMAFQPELHPGFENTIGALTGERAEPDRPRDYISEWEDRYDFERRFPSGDPKLLQQIDRILGVLHGFETTLDFVA